MKVYALHGNAQDKTIYNEFAIDNFIALNLPGHGVEEKLDYYSIENYAGFLIDKIEEDCILMGNSLGGHIGLEIATKHPKVKALISVGAPPISQNNFAEAFLPNENMGALYIESPTEDQMRCFCKDQSLSDKHYELLFGMFKKQDSNARVTLGESIQSGVTDEVEKINNLKIPFYAVFGTKDKFANIDYVKSLKLENYLEVESGHSVILDAPEYLAQLVTNIRETLLY